MDLVIGLLWCLAFSVIVLFLGALNYFLGRSHSNIELSDKKSQLDTTTQQRNSTKRKHTRNANKKQRQLAAATAISDHSNSNNEQETESVLSEIKIEEEEETLIDEEFEDPMKIEEVSHIEDEQKPIVPVKQRNKNKSNSTNSKSTISSKDESIFPLKPQASVAPVKQSLLPLIPKINNESTQVLQDNHSKSNGHVSSCNIYSYAEHNSLPPRFQQQRREKEEANGQKFRKRRSNEKKTKSFNSSASPVQQNDFLPLISKQQLNNTNNQLELSLQSSNQNGYSSESDMLTESSSTAPTLSTESQISFKRSDLLRSLSPSNLFLDELVSIFDTTSFSSDELELIVNKINAKRLLTKQDQQRLALTNKNEKTIERLLDETYRSQTKILAIELQSEKNRVLELTKVNAEMDNTIRQLQQSNNNNMIPYQQTILHYQMQMRQLTDENTRLMQQLHVYSTMPASINELKQQHNILNEQLRQITIRNSYLEKEIADGQQATKHAAEIYKKTDTQKQERIEQMANDLNKYKKIEKDLNIFKEKHLELEKDLNLKLDNITHQRDDLRKFYDELNEQIQHYEQLQIKYDQLLSNSINNEIQEELNEVKAKNDLLRQRNCKILDQLNKLHEQKSDSSS